MVINKVLIKYVVNLEEHGYLKISETDRVK